MTFDNIMTLIYMIFLVFPVVIYMVVLFTKYYKEGNKIEKDTNDTIHLMLEKLEDIESNTFRSYDILSRHDEEDIDFTSKGGE